MKFLLVWSMDLRTALLEETKVYNTSTQIGEEDQDQFRSFSITLSSLLYKEIVYEWNASTNWSLFILHLQQPLSTSYLFIYYYYFLNILENYFELLINTSKK